MKTGIRSFLATVVLGTASFGSVRSAAATTVDYRGGTYTQTFDSLPNPGAISVNTASAPVIDGITYPLPTKDGLPFGFDDATIGSGGRSLGGPATSGWYGACALAPKFGATFGDQTTGGVLSFGPPGSGNRAIGLIATSSSGATYLGVAIRNNTGAAISTVNVSFLGEIWKQGTTAKTLRYGFTVDNAAALNLVQAATAPSAMMLGSLAKAPGVVGAVDGLLATNQFPVSSTGVVLPTPWQNGGILWFTATMADASSNGQGYAIDNFNFSAVAAVPGAPLITAGPVGRTINAGGTAVLDVAATGTGLTYQWQFNGVNLPGATNASCVLANAGTHQAGRYTVVVTSSTGLSVTSTAAVVQVVANARPINVSARAAVGGGAKVVVAGFVVVGATSETVLIRGVGPTLASFGLEGWLTSPTLTVRDATNKIVGANAGWADDTTLAATAASVGAFPLRPGSADAVLVLTLAPGSYTVALAGTNGAEGLALVEVYDVPSR